MSTEENDNLLENSAPEDTESFDSAADAIQLIKYTAATDIGMRREENQDYYGVIESEHFRFFIVADGMGGVQGGATASKMAVSIVDQQLKDKKEITADSICQSVSTANKLIFEKGTEDQSLNGMGTTFVGLVFVQNKLLVVNVGDSRAYCVRNSRLLKLTEDHTLVMELVRSGTITPEQASNHPVSHMLTRSLGPTPEIEVDCYVSNECPLPNDCYLLCSDGLYNMVAESEMQDILTQYEIEEAAEMLIDLANQRGGTDNITLILIKTDPDFPASAEITKYIQEHHPADLSQPDEGSGEYSGTQVSPENFDPFAVPELDESIIKMRAASRPKEVSADEIRLEDKKEDVKSGPAAADEKAGEKKADEQPKTAFDAAPFVKEDDILPEKNTRTVILTGAMAGIIGGVVVLLISKFLLFNSDPDVSKVPENQQLKEDPVYQVPVPKIPNIPKSDPYIISMQNGPKTNPITEEINNKPAEISKKLQENLEYRKEKLSTLIADVKLNLERFNNPEVSGIAETIKQEQEKFDKISDDLRQVRSEIDNSTRKLAIWYGRKTRVKDADLTNLASEVSVSSAEVRKKKEEFELASWNYLKEAEALRYMPSDTEQRKKVDMLIDARNTKIQEMTEAVVTAIDKEIKLVEKDVTEFTIQREKLQDKLDYSERNIQYLNVLSGDNQELKLQSRQELENMLVSLESEFNELNNLLTVDKIPSEANIASPADTEVKDTLPAVN